MSRLSEDLPRQRVSALIERFEIMVARQNPQPKVDERPISRQSFVVDMVPDDPDDSQDYMVPRSPDQGPQPRLDSIDKPLRHRRSLPRISPPDVSVSGMPLPDAWHANIGTWSTIDETISPGTGVSWPTPAEAEAERKRLIKVDLQQAVKSQSQRTRALIVNSISGIGQKIKEKFGPKRRLSTPRGSEETFDLRTPRRVLESKPSFKSKAKRAARGAFHSVRIAPEVGADAIGQTFVAAAAAGRETARATSATAKNVRESATRTQQRVRSTIEDTKEKASTSIPLVRPPRSRYSHIEASQSATVEADNSGIPRPTVIAGRPRQRLRRRRYPPPPTIVSSNPSLVQPTPVVPSFTHPSLPPQSPPDAIFTPATISDVQWQASGSVVPMIIITEEDETEGSWYLPLNSVGQVQFQYALPRRSSSSSRKSKKSDGSESSIRSYLRRKRLRYNGRLSFGSIEEEVIDAELGMSGSDDRAREREVVNYTDETPLLIEFLTELEVQERMAARTRDRRSAVVWMPAGGLMVRNSI